MEQDPSYRPITMRTTAGYQWLRNTLVPVGDGTATTTTTRAPSTLPASNVFAGGTLGDNLNFLITYTPGLASSGFQLASTATSPGLESAWLGFNDILGSTDLNLRVGKHAVDLPIDEHRLERAYPCALSHRTSIGAHRRQSCVPAASGGPPGVDLRLLSVPAPCQARGRQSLSGDPGKHQAARIDRVRLKTQVVRDLLQPLQHVPCHCRPPR